MSCGAARNMPDNTPSPLLYQQRRAGVLLHPTSLPGPFRKGQISHAAYRFIEFLAQAGVSVWQMLPLGPTHTDDSPYLTLSAHANNQDLISLDWLQDRKLLDEPPQRHDFDQHQQLLQQACELFFKHPPAELKSAFEQYQADNAYWLDDYCLFMAIRETQANLAWTRWEPALRLRERKTLQRMQRKLHTQLRYQAFCQFIFHQQWLELKQFAHQHDVLLFGDIPIYVSLDSADVWAHPEMFDLDEQLQPRNVAGVPPDYFSATGQRWGNPVYRWDVMQADNFTWWQQRLHSQLDLFDIIRIDHFRGLRAYWAIPAEADLATAGHWVQAPGDELLQTLHDRFHALPLVAEDLGYITHDVHALRKKFNLPGMKILQFGFDGDSNNSHLPHQHEFASVVYTGTHDNDTSLAWYQGLDAHTRQLVREYFDWPDKRHMPWPLIRAALASVACLAIIPMQDLLELGDGHRMNTPGTATGNWQWRFEWSQLKPTLSTQLRELLNRYGR